MTVNQSKQLFFTYCFPHLILSGELLEGALCRAQALLQLLQHGGQLQRHHHRQVAGSQGRAPVDQLPTQVR